MNYEQYMKNLEVPKGKIDIVIDSDAACEIDDQFAIAYALENPQKLNIVALYAAPFVNSYTSTAKEGMKKSYDDIINILTLADKKDLIPRVFKGAENFLSSKVAPQISDASLDLCKRAMHYSPDNPLYVVSIGAITNIASALIMKPEIAENIVIIWIGGNEHTFPHTDEFNISKEIHGNQLVFDSKVPLVQIPLHNTIMVFAASQFEVEYLLKGKNALCDYLAELFYTDHDLFDEQNFMKKPITRILCDVCAIGWLLNDDNQFMESHLTTRPHILYDNSEPGLACCHYSFDSRRPLMTCIHSVNRDPLMCDLFEKLTKQK